MQLFFHWMPLLSGLADALAEAQFPLTDPRCQSFYQSVTTANINKDVGEMPSQFKSYYRRNVMCSCAHCGRLNHFLEDQDKGVQAFAATQQIRKHMEREIISARLECSLMTVKQGSPHQLLVSKTFAGLERRRRYIRNYHSDALTWRRWVCNVVHCKVGAQR